MHIIGKNIFGEVNLNIIINIVLRAKMESLSLLSKLLNPRALVVGVVQAFRCIGDVQVEGPPFALDASVDGGFGGSFMQVSTGLVSKSSTISYVIIDA